MNLPKISSSKRKAMNWTHAEMRKLLKLAGTMSTEDLTNHITGRTKSAIETKCSLQGISFRFSEASNG